MKILTATVLVLLLTVTPLSAQNVSAAEEPVLPQNITSILPDSGSLRTSELDKPALVASALDLSMFGVISLGVLGLFWIRRHTSEL